MSLAILRVGTAVPVTVIDQRQALTVARALACPTPEQDTWLPGMYAGTLIDSRRSALPAQVVESIQQAIKLAFVDSFQLLMFISIAVTLVSLVVMLLTVRYQPTAEAASAEAVIAVTE